MANLVLCNDGLKALLVAKRSGILQGAKLCLYKANIVPARTDTFLTYTGPTNEANFVGYARKPINWLLPPVITLAGQGQLNADLVTFLPTAITISNTIYGWFLLDPAEAYLIAAQRNPIAPITVGADLTPYTVLPVMLEASL